MLGRLARWLRVAGYDTLYLPMDTPDRRLVERAGEEGRVLLTRDRHLLRELRPARALEIRSDVPLEQLREVIDAFSLVAPRDLLTRCLVCNATLDVLSAVAAVDLLPPSARGLPGPVRRCPACGRVYWRGSHARRMRAALERAIPEWQLG